MKDMMDIIKGAEENRAPGRRSWIVTMAISLVAVGTGAPHCIVIMIILVFSTAVGTGAP